MRLFRDRKLRGALVVLNPKDGTAGLRGVVQSIDKHWITLIRAEIQNGNVSVEVQGERVLAPRENVAHLIVEATGCL